MLKKSLVALAMSGIAIGAMAQEATPTPDLSSAKFSKTRDQVKAELAEARRNGELEFGARTYAIEQPRMKSSKTRAQVRVELQEYVKSGQSEADRVNLYFGG